MLTELCAELKNYFLRDRENDIFVGTYTIADGGIESLAFLQNGQYFRIVGSVFNDGVHQYGDTRDVLTDETFDGAIWAMSVPPAVILLAEEIDSWNADNENTLSSPYQSESFGGYSYSKAVSSTGSGYSWKDQFASRLSKWRRLSVL